MLLNLFFRMFGERTHLLISVISGVHKFSNFTRVLLILSNSLAFHANRSSVHLWQYTIPMTMIVNAKSDQTADIFATVTAQLYTKYRLYTAPA